MGCMQLTFPQKLVIDESIKTLCEKTLYIYYCRVDEVDLVNKLEDCDSMI